MKNRIVVPMGAIWIGLMGALSPMALSQESQLSQDVMPVHSQNMAQSSRPLVVGLVQLVIERHPSIAAAKAELDGAAARGDGAKRALYNPELEAEFEDGDGNTKSVGLSQTLDWSGKRKANAAAGAADIAAAKAALTLVKKSVMTDLLAALGEHQSAFEAMQLSRAKIKLANEFLDIATRRKAAGDLSYSELLTAQLAVSQAMAEQAHARAEFSRVREQLAVLSGSQKTVWPFLVGTPNYDLLRTTNPVVSALPEMRFAMAQSNGFDARIRVADKMRKADPTIGLMFGQESDGLGGNATLFGVRLSIPLHIRNNYSHNVLAAMAEADQAKALAQNVHQTLAARLHATTKRVLDANSAWNNWQKTGGTQLTEQRQLLNSLWDAGEINAVSYLVQLEQTFDAEAASIELKGALWRSWFQWLDASNSAEHWLEAIQ